MSKSTALYTIHYCIGAIIIANSLGEMPHIHNRDISDYWCYNTIVWNEIHHKTESTSNYTGHGYPDEHYLDNVLAELAAQGVVEEGEGE